jgi:hypothetical protein
MDKRIDLLNSGLIIISLILAYLLPFRLFLFSYAVLGPLHYLTEINWLQTRKFWAPDIKWFLLALISVLIIVPPHVIRLLNLAGTNHILDSVIQNLNYISNGAIFLPLAIAFIMAFVKGLYWRIGLTIASILLAFSLSSMPIYAVIIGLLVPTIIHVYLFTLLFMVAGIKKNQTTYGIAGVSLMVFAPVIIMMVDVAPSYYMFPDYAKETFIANRFHATVAGIGKFLGVLDGTSFYFYERMELKLQTFIAFAYLYHYLNWFTKTSIIGWHSELKGRRLILVATLWSIMVGLFFIDYKLGFVAALSFSFLHVLLEFPLNALCIKEVFKTR